jgi:hypothetical protein
MDEKSLNSLTLSGWAASVWEKELRGVRLQMQEAALAWCMKQHNEWRNFWNGLNNYGATDTPRASNMLVHIYNDATVRMQLDSNSPPEINQLFQVMRAKGFTDMDALHAIAFVFQEQNWNAKTTGEAFDSKQYVERARQYVDTVIQHPEMVRGLRSV